MKPSLADRHVSRVALSLLAAVLLFPLPAFALPNPFVILLVRDILASLAVVLVAYLPALLVAVGRRSARYRSSLGTVLLILVALGAIAWLVTMEGDVHESRVGSQQEDSFQERLSACRLLEPELAARLGLPAGAILLDPRPNLAFKAYQALGSCNLSLNEVVESPEVGRLLASAGEAGVFLIEDRELGPGEFLAGVDADLPGVVFHKATGGLRRYYKNDEGLSVDEAPPDLAVDAAGVPVTKVRGDTWSLAYFAAVLGDDPSWRQVAPGAVHHALEIGMPVVDVREAHSTDGADHDGVIRIRTWNAHLGVAERLAGKRLDQVLFVCDRPPSCLAAEALAGQVKARGGMVAGYVCLIDDFQDTFGQITPLETILAGVPRLDPTESRVLAWLLFMSFMVVPVLLRSGFRRLLGRILLARPRMGSMLWPLRNLGPWLAFPLLIVAWHLSAGFVSDDLVPSRVHAFLIDSRRLGLGWWPFLAFPVIAIGIAAVQEHELGRRSFLVRVGALAGILYVTLASYHLFAMSELTVYRLLLVLAWVGGLLVRMGLVRLGEMLAIPRRDGSPGVISLASANRLPFAGGKVAGLARARKVGLRIPPTLVVACQADSGGSASPGGASLVGMPWEVAFCLRIVRELGPGPFVVRSSAPDEDMGGRPTPGRYLSVTDVPGTGLWGAVRSVLADYRAKGVPADAAVAVLIQPLVEGRWAGVAMREPDWRGGGIVVEASPKRNFDVTAGLGAAWRDRIGPFSRRWLLGAAGRFGPSARRFLWAFDALESRGGDRPEMEWTLSWWRLMVLQVRSAPVETPPDAATDSVSAAFDALSGDLANLTGRPRAAVLDGGELGDFHPACLATCELLRDLWDQNDTLKMAARLVGLWPMTALPTPPILRIDGRLYANRVPRQPWRMIVMSPIRTFLRLRLRLRMKPVIRLVGESLDRLEAGSGRDAMTGMQDWFSPGVARPPREAATRLLAARKDLLEGPGVVSVAVSLLAQALAPGRWFGRAARNRLLRETDPFLIALASVESGGRGIDSLDDALARRFPLRCMPDLALDRARLGERFRSIPGGGDRLDSCDVTAMETREAVACLRGRARVAMALHSAKLRFAYLELGTALGNADVFGMPISAIKELAAGGKSVTVPANSPGSENARQAPAGLVSLGDLERWAGEGRPDSPVAAVSRAGRTGIWIGEPVEFEGVAFRPEPGLSDASFDAGPVGQPVIWFLDAPDVMAIAAVPVGVPVVAASGSALCHAALVARARGVPALFQAGESTRSIVTGQRVRLTRSGRVLSLADEHPE